MIEKEVFWKRRDLGKGSLSGKRDGMNENLFRKRFFVFLLAGIFLILMNVGV